MHADTNANEFCRSATEREGGADAAERGLGVPSELRQKHLFEDSGGGGDALAGAGIAADVNDCMSVASGATTPLIHHLPLPGSPHHLPSPDAYHPASPISRHGPMRKRKMSLNISLLDSDCGLAELSRPGDFTLQLQPLGHDMEKVTIQRLPLPTVHGLPRKRKLSVDIDYERISGELKLDDSERLDLGKPMHTARDARSNIISSASAINQEEIAAKVKHENSTTALDHLDALGDDHADHHSDLVDHSQHESHTKIPHHVEFCFPSTSNSVLGTAANDTAARARSRTFSLGGLSAISMSSGPLRKRKLSLDISLPSFNEGCAIPNASPSVAMAAPPDRLEDQLTVAALVRIKSESSMSALADDVGAPIGRKLSDGDRSGGCGGIARADAVVSDVASGPSPPSHKPDVCNQASHSGSNARGHKFAGGNKVGHSGDHIDNVDTVQPGRKLSDADLSGSQESGSTLNLTNQRLLLDALMAEGGRDRSESWGEMSELSFAGHAAAVSDAAAVIAMSSGKSLYT